VDRCVQLPAQFDLPTHAVEVGHLSRTDPRGKVREEEAVALRRLHTHEPEMERVRVAADLHISIDSLAGERQCVGVQQGIAGGAGEQLPGDLSTRHRVPLGLPVVLELDDDAHALGCAGSQACQARLGQVGEQPGRPARTRRSAEAGGHAHGRDSNGRAPVLRNQRRGLYGP
jgi:hypothetical protein